MTARDRCVMPAPELYQRRALCPTHTNRVPMEEKRQRYGTAESPSRGATGAGFCALRMPTRVILRLNSVMPGNACIGVKRKCRRFQNMAKGEAQCRERRLLFVVLSSCRRLTVYEVRRIRRARFVRGGNSNEFGDAVMSSSAMLMPARLRRGVPVKSGECIGDLVLRRNVRKNP